MAAGYAIGWTHDNLLEGLFETVGDPSDDSRIRGYSDVIECNSTCPVNSQSMSRVTSASFRFCQ